jgi:hypothetical protein
MKYSMKTVKEDSVSSVEDMDTLGNTAKTLSSVETVQPLAIPITTVLSERPTGVLSIRDQQQTTLYRHKTV